MPSSPLLRGALYILLSELMFVLMGTQIKLIAVELPNELIVSVRNAVGLLLVLPILFKHGFHTLKTAHPGLHLIRGSMGLLAMYSFFYAIANLPLANAMILKMSAPLFIPFIAYFWLKEGLTLRLIALSLIGFCGVALVIQPGFSDYDKVALIALSGGLFAAFAKTTVRRLTHTEPPYRIVFYFALIGFIFSLIPLFPAWVDPSPEGWIRLMLVGLFATLGQLFMTRGYGQANAAELSPFSYSSVLFASVIGWLFWGEWMNLLAWFGTLILMTTGVLLVQRKRQAQT